MRKILMALALLSLVATNAEAGGGHGHGHSHGHGGGYSFWWGAALGAALTIPFYYSRSWADPGPYYYSPYDGPGPVVYANPPVYVQSQPVYVQRQPNYAAVQPAAVTQAPSNGVIELGPVNASIHKIDEHVSLDELEMLPQLHRRVAELLLG